MTTKNYYGVLGLIIGLIVLVASLGALDLPQEQEKRGEYEDAVEEDLTAFEEAVFNAFGIENIIANN